MGILLGCVELFLGEIAHWQWVPDAHPVYGLVEDVCFSADKMAVVDDLGIVVTFGFEGFILLGLVGDGFVAAKVFDGLVTGDILDVNRVAVGVIDCECGWWLVLRVDRNLWCSTWIKVIVDEVVLAFGQFQGLVGRCQQVVP